MSKLIKRASAQDRLNIRRAVIVIATAGWLQTILVLALALMFFTGNRLPAAVLLVVLIVFILFANYTLMRRSLSILNAQREMAEVEATLESATELNRRLRSQRHDFMNHLQVVYALMEMGEYTEACDYIDNVYKDIQSVSGLLRTDNAAVNALLAAKQEAAADRAVAMEFDIRSRATGLALEDCDLCAVLGNIIDNSLDALEGKEGGKVRIRLWEELGGFNFAVENNGPPVPAGLAEQIFEPGFTTKGERGQGLGLHIVREALQACGGAVEALQVGEWTRFAGHIPKTSEGGRP